MSKFHVILSDKLRKNYERMHLVLRYIEKIKVKVKFCINDNYEVMTMQFSNKIFEKSLNQILKVIN